MPLNEAETRSALIDPATYARGWTEECLKFDQTAGAGWTMPPSRSHPRLHWLRRPSLTVTTRPLGQYSIALGREALGEGADRQWT